MQVDDRKGLLAMKIREVLEKESELTSPKDSDSTNVKLDLRTLKKNHCVSMFPNIPEAESYKVLRTQILQRTREKNLNTVMII